MSESAGESTLQRSNQRVGSLRWRVTLLIIMLSTIIQGTLCVVLILYNRRSLDESMTQRIRLRLSRIVRDVEEHQGSLSRDDLAKFAAEHLLFIVPERFAIVVYRLDGSVMASSVARPPSSASAPFRQAVESKQVALLKLGARSLDWLGEDLSSGAWTAMTSTMLGGREPVVVSLTISQHYFEHMASAVERPVLLLIGMGVVASGVAGWLVTGRLLGPLSRLTQLATTLRPEHLEQEESGPNTSVAELQVLQDSLRETRESLRLAFRAQERFLSNVAHELKTPIAVLIAEAQTIDRAGLNDEGARFVGSVHEEMKRMGKLVESFLLLAKVHAGKALLKSEVIFINDVVMSAVEQCGIMARQYSVTLVPTLLDGEASNSTVAGDPTLLQTMIDGLIRNAIKFSPHGGKVDIVAEVDDCTVSVCVRDQGPGIAPEIAQSLFDRFVQAPAETARGRGTGLGLAIAQGIAEMHSGRITFENKADSGCEFCVRFPLAKLDTTESLSEI